MNRIVLAFRAFFNLLFSGELSSETLIALNLSRRSAAAPAKAAAPAPAAPAVRSTSGSYFGRRTPDIGDCAARLAPDRFPDGGRLRLFRRSDRGCRAGASRSVPRGHWPLSNLRALYSWRFSAMDWGDSSISGAWSTSSGLEFKAPKLSIYLCCEPGDFYHVLIRRTGP